MTRKLELSFEELGAKKFEGDYYEGNEASAAVMKNCGMTYQGLKRKFECKGNTFNEINYSITLDNYKALRANLMDQRQFQDTH